ncbi:MAG: SDR family oxidoreductase [Acidimicrobiales bacterium]|jgi:NAD(P)-dependent dehydrogenase (short-subunit alcohol dehydrogenase family)|nr:SDR family oxidoreductase [Acidimicrobiales bacterium]
MNFDLQGRVAIVTGGNGGIGLGIAEALAGAGADVVVWGRNEDKNEQARALLAETGRRVLAQRCDVGDEDDVEAAFAAAVAAMGKVDILVANAGVGGYAPFVSMSLEEWHRVQRTNLDGVFLSFREAARHLVDRREGGALVAVSSTSAIHGAPGMQHYAAAKAGLLAMTRGLAVELARHRVRCNALLPGWTETDMLGPMASNPRFVENTIKRTPVRRWAVPADLGPAAVFLSDPSYTFHTGDCVVVDGGYTIF